MTATTARVKRPALRRRRRREVRRVVAALIVRRGKVLICQRAPDDPMPLKWEFPGGKIERRESARAALVRELKEELGIAAVIGREVVRIRHRYTSGTAVELQFFRVTRFSGAIENRIFADIAWVGPRQIVKYDFLEADAPLVRDIAAGTVL